MNTVTIPATTDAYAPNQVEYVLTEAEKSEAALYAIQLERMRREANKVADRRANRAGR